MTQRRIAFYVHEAALIGHYRPVWRFLDPASVTIVCIEALATAVFQESSTFLDQELEAGFSICSVEMLPKRPNVFAVGVSNHPIAALPSEHSPPHSMLRFAASQVARTIRRPLRQGPRAAEVRRLVHSPGLLMHKSVPRYFSALNVRFPYGFDVSEAWGLDQSVYEYDVVLAHGRLDSQVLSTRVHVPVETIGYPRYEEAFRAIQGRPRRQASESPYFLWLPTMDGVAKNDSSLDSFARVLPPIYEDTRILVRPHPIDLRNRPWLERALSEMGFVVDADPITDVPTLMAQSNGIIFDRGGSGFGAILLGLPAIRLASETRPPVPRQGLENLLDEVYPAFSESTLNQGLSILADKSYWLARIPAVKTIRDDMLDGSLDGSGARAAKVLKDLGGLGP